MSDIIVPGISTNRSIDTSKLIEDLMEVERIPVRRLENNVSEYEVERETWQTLGRIMSQLRDASRSLFSFENPFRERTAAVSNAAVLTASADRTAQENIESITVLQTASTDRFSSKPLPKNFHVQEGIYEFSVGEKSRSVQFSGGTLEDFTNTINKHAGEIIKTTVIPATDTANILIFEGIHAGESAKLTFHKDALTFAQETAVLLPPAAARAVSFLHEEPLVLQPLTQHSISFDEPFSLEQDMVLRFEARIQELDKDIPLPINQRLPQAGDVRYKGITIQNEGSDFHVPPSTSVQEVFDNKVFTVNGISESRLLDALPDSPAFQMVEVASEQLPSSITSFLFDNKNTGRAVEIRNISIINPKMRGDHAPQQALSTARDARILYKGVEVQRNSNTIDDLIPGVTLTLHREDEAAVEIAVQPNRENAKNAIIGLIGFYNQVIRDINIYTRNDATLIDQIEYFSEEERETMRERLGILQGDSSLNQLRSRMQNIMANSYNTGVDSPYRILAQIGISTNANGAASGVDTTRLRGYLEINEAELDEALATNFEATARLFGNDSDNDLIADTGAAVTLTQFITPYVQTGGIISNRTTSLSGRIQNTETQIGRYNEKLEDYEQNLRNEFGQMEGALQQLQENSRAFDNLGNTNNNQ